jgi:HEAT repeat protein
VVRSLALAILSAWFVLAAEFAAVALLNQQRIASVWELSRGGVYLAPPAFVVAALFAAVGLLLVRLLQASRQKLERGVFAGLWGCFAAVVAFGVGGGRHLSALPIRLGFALGVGLLAVLAAWLLARPARRLFRDRPLWMTLVAGLVILALELLNRFVLVRLYPAFHHGLGAAALLLSPLLAAPWLSVEAEGAPRRALFVPLGLTVLLGVSLPFAARRLAHFDNFRLVLLERAPLLGRAVELAAHIAPPPGFDDEDCASGDSSGELASEVTAGRTLDLAGRDLLLITVDALRADHLGAYGYERPTTPALDALAREGVLFEYAYAPTPHTSYSVTSLMTGKYMRPLLLQDAGQDSDTWAGLLRTYGYRTAAFYPPAIFFIDPQRFAPFQNSFLGFEYRWVEFAEGEKRLSQVRRYLDEAPSDKPLFVWVHLFSPHEPYEAHPDFPFGDRDVDRYDSEIAAADRTLGEIVEAFREKRPQAAVIVTADHGEEFGEHGGRYHGTSVHEEQVRVPMLIAAPGAVTPRRVREPVQTIDLLPTVLSALDIPRPPRVRGRDLGPLVTGRASEGKGLAFAETDDQVLLAEATYRLVCQRRVGACQLFDVATDPYQQRDIARDKPREFETLRTKLKELAASHGRYEASGLRKEGKGWPAAILRALSGDADAAEELTSLLDDADLAIRRKAAELLFEVKRPETAPALRLALRRDEDEAVKRWSALALTRLGEGAPLASELMHDKERSWRRVAALALAESNDRRGEAELVAWWQDAASRDFERSRQLLAAFGALRTKDAVWPLLKSLSDVRLRPYIAQALARIGDEAARGPLVVALKDERSQSSRQAIVKALVALKAREELALPLVRFLGVPDPLEDGVRAALESGILHHVGGPKASDLRRLNQQSAIGVAIPVVVPSGGNGKGTRVILRARARGKEAAEVIFGSASHLVRYDRNGELKKQRGLPALDNEQSVRVKVPAGEQASEIAVTLPASWGVRPGLSTSFIVYGGRDAEIEGFVVVPLADELPPPAPEPWKAGSKGGSVSERP